MPGSGRSRTGWLEISGPSGQHLVDLIRHSDDVLDMLLIHGRTSADRGRAEARRCKKQARENGRGSRCNDGAGQFAGRSGLIVILHVAQPSFHRRHNS